MWWWLFACAQVQPPAPPAAQEAPLAAPAAEQPAPVPAVRFAPGGRVVVDERLLLDPATGVMEPLEAGAVLSPSGARLAWVKDATIHWSGGEAAAPALAGEPSFLLAFADEDHLYVRAQSIVAEDGALDPQERCELISLVDASRRDAPCVSGDFVQVYALALAGGVAAVGSAGEGHPGLRVVGFDVVAGEREVGWPGVDLYHSGPAEASVRGDGSVDILTPCLLVEQPQRPCMTPDGEADRSDQPWRHYRWSQASGLALVREGLPAGAAADPSDVDYAWGRPGMVCQGFPDQKSPRCWPVAP